MDQDREWLKLNGRFAGHPPGHAQVHQLQKAMEAAILQTITNVNRKLGPLAAAQLRTYLRNEIAPHLTIQKLSPETQHDPHLESHEALGGYALEVQR